MDFNLNQNHVETGPQNIHSGWSVLLLYDASGELYFVCLSWWGGTCHTGVQINGSYAITVHTSIQASSVGGPFPLLA